MTKKPIFIAALHNQETTVKHFIARGAQVNIKDNADYTPLVFAQQNHHIRIMAMLKKAGETE